MNVRGKKGKGPIGERDPANFSSSIPILEETPPHHRSGFVAIVGRPNVGKSTLLNRILGHKLAITTRKPGTTRQRLVGVHTTSEGQVIFLDTPGIERPGSKLGRFLLEEVKAGVSGADVVVFVTEARDEQDEEDRQALKLLGNEQIPFFLVFNKVDLVRDKVNLLPLIDRYKNICGAVEIFPVSALKGDNVSNLLSAIMKRVPEGPRYFPPNVITDELERRLIEELVREQVYLQLHREIPYAIAVQLIEMSRDPKSNRLHVEANIFVERKSQRGIVIGKGGQRLKSIGQASRLQIERRLGESIFLGLNVGVNPNWRQRDSALRELGYQVDP